MKQFITFHTYNYRWEWLYESGFLLHSNCETAAAMLWSLIIFGILWLKWEDLATDKTCSLPSFLSLFWSLLYILQVSDFRQSTRPPLCVLTYKGNFVFWYVHLHIFSKTLDKHHWIPIFQQQSACFCFVKCFVLFPVGPPQKFLQKVYTHLPIFFPKMFSGG